MERGAHVAIMYFRTQLISSSNVIFLLLLLPPFLLSPSLLSPPLLLIPFFQGLKYLFFNNALGLHIAALPEVPMENAGDVDIFSLLQWHGNGFVIHFRGFRFKT